MKKAKSEFSTKDVPQHARYIKAGYYTVQELRELLKDLETHVRISDITDGVIELGGDS